MEQNLGSDRIAVRLLGYLKPYWGLGSVYIFLEVMSKAAK